MVKRKCTFLGTSSSRQFAIRTESNLSVWFGVRLSAVTTIFKNFILQNVNWSASASIKDGMPKTSPNLRCPSTHANVNNILFLRIIYNCVSGSETGYLLISLTWLINSEILSIFPVVTVYSFSNFPFGLNPGPKFRLDCGRMVAHVNQALRPIVLSQLWP